MSLSPMVEPAHIILAIDKRTVRLEQALRFKDIGAKTLKEGKTVCVDMIRFYEGMACRLRLEDGFWRLYVLIVTIEVPA